MKNFLLSIAILITPLFFVIPVSASEIRLDSHKSEITVGEQFLVEVIIHSEESLNAIEGRLVFPENMLSIKEIRDGNSVVNFWLEKPHVDIESSSVVLFSGITPGGFKGANNNIFTIVFEAKEKGIVTIAWEGTKALLNNGSGTETSLLSRGTTVSIESGDGNVQKEILVDTEIPEDFNPIIANDSNIFDGKYFIVFATQDKSSGIAGYKVREGRWGWFNDAESPYLLKHQSLDRKIFIKAIDRSGNERTAVLDAQNQTPWYRSFILFGIILLVAAFIFRICLKRTK